MLFTHLKKIYQFYKTEIGNLIFDMGIAGFEYHMKEKGVEWFDPEFQGNCTVWLLCFFLILIDVQNENLSFDKCIHRTVSSKHTVWEALL